MAVQVRPSGPIPARIMIVGEAPGFEEERDGEPFVGASGKELTRMLHDAGINRSECFITNVARERPQGNDISHFIATRKKDITDQHSKLRDKYVKRQILEGYELLVKELEMVQPNIVIALGNTSLWALTGEWGIMKWRGSMMYVRDLDGNDTPIKLVPTVHPALILRSWENRQIAVHDLKRAARFRGGEPYPVPDWDFHIRPSFVHASGFLSNILNNILPAGPLRISFDIETRGGHIACAGISYDNHGLCIPLMCVENPDGYWPLEEEAVLVHQLYRVLTHPNAQVIGQNLLYDSQYTYRHWHFIPRVYQDTMISHHTAFVGLPKRLDFQASMYCDSYRYWKDDSKDWSPKLGEDQLWIYNLEDCVRTDECASATKATVEKLGQQEQEAFLQSMFWPVLEAMNRGVRIDTKVRDEMAMELMDELTKREVFFEEVLGHTLNPKSPQQMARLFYEDLKLPVQINRQTKRPTLDEDALQKLALREPLVAPLVKAITEYRSIGVFLSTFVAAPLDLDGRMRCSYNICGTESLRLSSSKNAFGSGANLQTVPKGTKRKEPEDLELPNIRKLFVPDPGYTFFDMDLDRADLQVVVWEADDENLKKALRMGVDMHCMNAVDIYRIKGIPIEELVEGHPNYPERRGQIGEDRRHKAKGGVHAVDYACKSRTLATALGTTVKEADKFINDWFAAHPGIKRWHTRIEALLHTKRCITNAYGFRRFYFGRIDNILPEALAWIPQSTVAITINKIWKNLYDNHRDIQVLLQVHDSLAGQFPTSKHDQCMAQLKQASEVYIPYPDPLLIPTGIKTSPESWGAVK